MTEYDEFWREVKVREGCIFILALIVFVAFLYWAS